MVERKRAELLEAIAVRGPGFTFEPSFMWVDQATPAKPPS